MMTETNTESSTAGDSAVVLSEISSTTVLPSSSSSNTIDDEMRRRRIISKLWGKGNKSSHKVRELEKSTINNNSDSLVHNDNDQQHLADNPNHLSSFSHTSDRKSSTEDSSNSINSSKPLAVVKPIVVIKSGLIVASATDRTRVNSEASSSTTTQTDGRGATTTTVTEKQSASSTTTTERTSSKKKKSHKHEDSKKKKTIKEKSSERDRSHHHNHHQTDEDTNKKVSSSSKTHRREHNEEQNNNHHKSSHHQSSSTTSISNNRRRSPSNNTDPINQKSSRLTTSKKEEPSSSKKSTLSPVDHHSKPKHDTSTHHHRHRDSSKTRSPSRSRHSTTTGDRLQTKHSSSPKKDDRSSTTTIKSDRQPSESISNSKSTNSISPTDVYSKHRQHGSETIRINDTHRHKTRTSDENLMSSSKTQEISPDHHHRPSSSSSAIKQDRSKIITNNHEHDSNRRKPSSSRHRSRSQDDRTHRKTIEPSTSHESSVNKTKTNHEKDSTTNKENSHHDKKSSRGSSIPSTNEDHRRKSSSDYHRQDRPHSPSNHDRRTDHRYDRHRIPYYPDAHYVHHHHHHHYRSTSSRYHHHHRRSISPRSHPHRSRYFSSTSSSLSLSPRRRSLSRTSSSSTRSSSSYSSISRTSSSSTSRSSSRQHRYYPHERKFRRSPTLEKLFLKASESIESVSTQKNPHISSSTHLISVQTTNTTPDMPITSLSETNTFYPDTFAGFSVPPPPFLSQPHQRCLKEITTESSTSRRLVLNEVQTIPSSKLDEMIPIKTVQSSELSTNVRSTSSKPPRVSRFSDITSSVTSEPVLNTNIPVDTLLDYSQISENINCLSSSRRQQKRHNREVMECECTTSEYDRSHGSKACGIECLNRMLLIECGPMCPCGQWCTNRRFQRRSYASHKLALFKTAMKGYGLRTMSSIRKGRFLVEYVGEVIDMDELARRNKKYKQGGNIHQYVMSLIHGTVIDSTMKGNWARFINHSCEPNCVAEKWLVNGEYRMGIFAKRDLNLNEEITIDYRFETFGTVDLASEKCYCGAPTCRGTISIKTNNHHHLNKRQNRRQPLDDVELLDYLRDDDTNEYIIPKTIDEIRQLIQIMSRTDSENVRTIELDLIKNNSQKQFELPRLFLECNGLHVLCSWMKDILIDNNIDGDDDQQQYSDEFKYHLLDFIHTVLPIKDRTIVVKNGLVDLVYKKLQLPSSIIVDNNDHEQINHLMNSMLDHLENPILAKLFHIYSTWMSFKERYIIPKRKEQQELSNHHHHRHHHHHSSKYRDEENSSRLSFSTRSSTIQSKPVDRPFGRRSFVMRETPRTQEQQLSKDERRKLFEQQYEDEEKARAAAVAAAINGESPGTQNEPPHKKQRTSDNAETMVPSTPPQQDTSSMSNINSWTFPSNATDPHQMDQTYWIHQHLSQIPIDYIRSYLTSIGQSSSVSSTLIDKEEPALPPPARPDDENELSRIIRLPSGWSVAVCPSDSSVYFYNRQTMATSWTPPVVETPTDNSISHPPLDLSPLSTAQLIGHHHPHHHQHLASSSRPTMKLSKHPHRHSRNHRHYHLSSNNKRKRPSAMESTSVIKEELRSQSIEDASMMISNEQVNQEETEDKKPVEHIDEMSTIDENTDVSTTIKESSEIHDHMEEPMSSNNNPSSSKINRDHLRKNISQHVHTTLKPYTKRTCKQGRIVSTDDIKHLVKKFTLAVLDKEIEKAKNEGIPLSPILTDRVRLKTEVYVKKYMNKMGPVFQRHDPTVQLPSQLPPAASSSSSSQPTTTNSE